MHTIIDESVLLRYLLNDDKVNSRKARSIIASGNARTYPEYLARCAITLRDVYRVPRSMIGTVLLSVLSEINVSEPKIVEYAIRLFASSALDFSDCMTLARNAIAGNPILSFNRPIMKKSLFIEGM
jgi:hypothetical protein